MISKRASSKLFVFLLCITISCAQAQTQLGTDINGDSAGDVLSRDISLSADGNVLAVGMRIGGIEGYGDARVFEWIENSWQQVGANFNDTDDAYRSVSGVHLSGDGNRLVLSRSGENGIGDVRIFQRMGSQWEPLSEVLTGTEEDESFGQQIAFSSDGTTVAIKSSRETTTENPSPAKVVDIFRWSEMGWEKLGSTFIGNTYNEHFGKSISLSSTGKRVAISAYRNSDSLDIAGRTQVFEWSGLDWVQLGDDIFGEGEGDQSGYSISLSANGNRIAIGAPDNVGDDSVKSGHVRVFEWTGSSWVPVGEEIESFPNGIETGLSVSISGGGNRLAIADPYAKKEGDARPYRGQVRLFEWSGVDWKQVGETIFGNDIYDQFGWSVALSSNGIRVASRAELNGTYGDDTGRISVFDVSSVFDQNKIFNGLFFDPSNSGHGFDFNVHEAGTTIYYYGHTIDGERLWLISELFMDEIAIGIPHEIQMYEVVPGTYGLPIEPATVWGAMRLTLTSPNTGRVSLSGQDGLLDMEFVRLVGLPSPYGNSISDQITQLCSDIVGESPGDQAGYSVSLSRDGTILAIGTPFSSKNSKAGQVRVYRSHEDFGWQQIGNTIEGDSPDDYAGVSISLSEFGKLVAISHIGSDDNGIDSGKVGVFELNGEIWRIRGDFIYGINTGDSFGRRIYLSSDGDRLAIGNEDNDHSGEGAGKVQIYDWNGISWVQLGESFYGEAPFDRLGGSISLSKNGDIVAIGAYGHDGDGSQSGQVKVFRWDGQSWALLGSELSRVAPASFGRSVSLSDDGMIVGIGAPSSDQNGHGSGSVFVYGLVEGDWSQLGQTLNGRRGDGLGRSISISGDGSKLAMSGPNAYRDGAYRGAVDLFQWSGTNWQQLSPELFGSKSSDDFGFSVSLSKSGQRLAVGSRAESAQKDQPGYARTFMLPSFIRHNGLYFDPDNSGHGFDINVHEFGLTAYYYGHTINGERLWLISELYKGVVQQNVPIEVELYELTDGVFGLPNSETTIWGQLTFILNNCDTGVAQLVGKDGALEIDFVKLVGLSGYECEQ